MTAVRRVPDDGCLLVLAGAFARRSLLSKSSASAGWRIFSSVEARSVDALSAAMALRPEANPLRPVLGIGSGFVPEAPRGRGMPVISMNLRRMSEEGREKPVARFQLVTRSRSPKLEIK